jgi:hypothetical protein
MIRRDYILRMIDEFVRLLAEIQRKKREGNYTGAQLDIDEESKRLTGLDPAALAILSDTEVFSRLLQTSDFETQREKIMMLSRVLMEAAEARERAGSEPALPRALRLKALHLLLNTVLRGDVFEWPEFVPKIDILLAELTGAPLPLQTHALLMQHFERSGQFAKAEDALFAMMDAAPGNRAILELGISFYHRLLGQSDSALISGDLPRAEVEAGLNDIRIRWSKTAAR